MNKTHIIAETGAGQHGVATATVCSLFNIKCTIFMGKEDIKRQSVNVEKMKLLGADIEWDGSTSTVTANKNDTSIKLPDRSSFNDDNYN